MYERKNKNEKQKMYISDHEYTLLTQFYKTLYEPYFRKSVRPISNFYVREKEMSELEK